MDNRSRMRIASLVAVLCTGAAVMRAARAADIVVIVNLAAPPPTREQIAAVFLGRSQEYTPVDQGVAAPIRAEFYQKATGRDLAQVKATWSRIAFTGRGLPPREYTDAASIKRAVAADPNAMGYIDKAALDPSVKAALTLD